MPRAVDRRDVEADFDPNRSGTEFHIQQYMLQQGEAFAKGLELLVEQAHQAVIEFIKGLTGIDLGSVEDFFESLFTGLLGNIGLDLPALAALNPITLLQSLLGAFQGIDITNPGSILAAIAHALEGVPVLGDVVHALTGIANGDYSTLTAWASRVPLLNLITGFLSGGVIPGLDASKITSGQFAQSMISGLTAFLNAIPGGNIVGTILASVIPGLDASKITSGSFPQSMITGLTSFLSAIPGGNIVGSLLASVIPGLDASKITSGSFPQSMVSGLTAFLSAIPGGNIVGSILASVVPGLDASKITSGSLPQSMISGLTAFLNAIPGGNIIGTILASVIPGLDASKITTGSFGQAQVSGLTTNLNNLGAGIQATVNGIVNSLQGLTGAYWTQAQANAALAAQAAATAAAAAALAQLQGSDNQSNTGGVAEYVDFSTYPNSVNLPANFTETYSGGSGSSTGTYGVNGGKADVTSNEAAYIGKDVYGVYNVKTTLTDYQRIGAVWTAAPGVSWQNPTPFFTPSPWYNPYQAYAALYCRWKDVNNWVRVKFGYTPDGFTGMAWLECCVNGTVTSFASTTHAFQPNTAYWLEAGTAGGLRIYRVMSGTTPIMTYTDASSVSQVGAAFRGGTFGGALVGAQGAGTPANMPPMLGFSFQDNNVNNAYLGKQARWFRANTNNVATGTNGTMVPNGFFDTADYNVGGIFAMNNTTAAASNNCRLTVSEKGLYQVIFRSTVAGNNLPTIGYLWKNGTLVKRGGAGGYEQESVWMINLAPNDYLNVGTACPSGGTYFGDAAGAFVYIEIRQVLGVQ